MGTHITHTNREEPKKLKGADVVTVTAKSSNDHVFEVAANWVDVSGFAVIGSPS